jgi:hypothetical protein
MSVAETVAYVELLWYAADVAAGPSELSTEPGGVVGPSAPSR